MKKELNSLSHIVRVYRKSWTPCFRSRSKSWKLNQVMNPPTNIILINNISLSKRPTILTRFKGSTISLKHNKRTIIRGKNPTHFSQEKPSHFLISIIILIKCRDNPISKESIKPSVPYSMSILLWNPKIWGKEKISKSNKCKEKSKF